MKFRAGLVFFGWLGWAQWLGLWYSGGVREAALLWGILCHHLTILTDRRIRSQPHQPPVEAGAGRECHGR